VSEPEPRRDKDRAWLGLVVFLFAAGSATSESTARGALVLVACAGLGMIVNGLRLKKRR